VAAPAPAAVRTTVKDPALVRVAPPDPVAGGGRAAVAVPVRLIRPPPAATTTGTTTVATAAPPLTRVARGAVASVSGRFAPADAKDRLAGLTAALAPGAEAVRRRADGSAAPGGQLLRPGELAVLQLPNAAFDTDTDAPRPRLAVTGGPARVVALAPGGTVLDDGPGSPDGRAVPIGAERLAVLAGAAADGVAGWHSGQQLAYVGWSTAVCPGATVCAEGAQIARIRDRYRAGWIPGAELIDTATVVTTRFPVPATVVAVLIDDPLGTEAARGLALGLQGARRPDGPDGRPRPPDVVALGNRTALVYPVEPAPRGPLSVDVASQAGWHLAGVLAAAGDPAQLVDRLGRHGVDAVVRPLVAPVADLVTLRWLEP
jgi:hypothetical protein